MSVIDRSEFYWCPITCPLSDEMARRLDELVGAIDLEIRFVGPLGFGGHALHGFLARPEDGLNDLPFRVEHNGRVEKMVRDELRLMILRENSE